MHINWIQNTTSDPQHALHSLSDDSSRGSGSILLYQSILDANKPSLSGSEYSPSLGESQILTNAYIIFLGVLANFMILAACVTAMALVRKCNHQLLVNVSSHEALDDSFVGGTPRTQAGNSSSENSNRKRYYNHQDIPSQPGLPTMTIGKVFSVSSDVYKLLSSCPPPRNHHHHHHQSIAPAAAAAALGSHCHHNASARIPEFYASQNVDVQTMLISSANVDQFFIQSRGPKIHHQDRRISSGIWNMT
jgi:hypothetical protein